MRFLLLVTLLLACADARADKPSDEYTLRQNMCQLALQNVPVLSSNCRVEDAGIAFANTIARRRNEPRAASPLLDRATASFCIEDVLLKYEEARAKSCDPRFDPADLAAMRTFLDAWYAERTVPQPTGDADVDRALAGLAAARDATCACKPKDDRCIDKAAPASPSGDVTRRMSPKARVQMMSIASELGRCGRGRSFGLYK